MTPITILNVEGDCLYRGNHVHVPAIDEEIVILSRPNDVYTVKRVYTDHKFDVSEIVVENNNISKLQIVRTG